MIPNIKEIGTAGSRSLGGIGPLPSTGRSVLPGTAAVNGRMPGLPGMLNPATASYPPEI